MLSFHSFFRNSARKVPGLDLRQVLRVGDKIALKKPIAKLQTTNPTAKPGDEVLSTARLMQQFERLAASMIESNLDNSYKSEGLDLKVDHRKPAYLGIACTFKAEVTDVSESKATFKEEVVDSRTGEVFATGVHSRVVLKPEEDIQAFLKD